MQVTVIGSSGSYPSLGNPGSCYLVDHAGTRVLLDLGSGALGALAAHVDVLTPDCLDAVILTHLHADHMVDMAAMLVARTHGPAGPLPPLPVWGPVGTAARIADVAGSTAGRIERRFTVGSLVDGARITIGSLSILSRQLRHSVESFGLRIEADGRALTYSGDSAMTDALVELAHDADVALIEATWPEPDTHEKRWPEGVHLSGREAGQIARRAGVRHLVLTHHAPWADAHLIATQASDAFSGPISRAQPGMTLVV